MTNPVDDLPAVVVAEAWHEYCYPAPAVGDHAPRFKRVIAVINQWLATRQQAAESSRRDWAAEAMRLQVELERLERNQSAVCSCGNPDHIPHPFSSNAFVGELCNVCSHIKDVKIHLLHACACISDDQATQLGPGFTRPVCAVHPTEESA